MADVGKLNTRKMEVQSIPGTRMSKERVSSWHSLWLMQKLFLTQELYNYTNALAQGREREVRVDVSRVEHNTADL